MINLLNSNHSSAKSLKNNRGGYSQNLLAQFLRYIKRSQVSDIASVCSETDIPLRVYKSHANNAVTTRLSRANHALCYADYQGVSYGSKGKRFDFQRCMRYAAMLLLCFVVGVGNVWGIDWNSKSWIACSGPCYSSAYESYKYNINSGSPNVVEIQYPDAWASACGIYITFATDVGLSVNTLTANTDYKQQGAGIIFYLSYFTAQETTVTGSCNGSSWSFTIYNKNGSAGCTAPNHVDISGIWDYFGGETISLTAQAYSSAGTGSPIAEADITGYQWKHNGSAIVGATSKTFTKTNCTAADGGDYTCVVSTSATCSTESSPMGTKVYVLQCYTGGETSYNFTRTGSSQAGTTEVTLANNTQYEFKIYAGSTASTDYYMGNNGTIEQDVSNWDFEGGKNNVKLNSGLGGTFTFAIDYSANGGAPKVSVTYPRKTIYMKCGSTWCDASPVFFAHTYGVNNYDVKLTQDVCDVTIYYGIIPAYNSKVIFTRQKPGSESIAWSGNANYWNESEEITLSTYDLFTCTGWSDGKGTFSRDTYSPTTYTISFEGNGNTSGSMTDVEDISCAEDVDLATNAYVRTGYTFSHWTANVDVKVGDATITAGSAIANSATIQEIASNITLTANWTAKTYNITLAKNHSDTGTDGSATVTYGSKTLSNLIAPSARTGYTIRAYYVSPESGSAYAANYSGTLQKSITDLTNESREWIYDGDVTLYTKWNGIQYDVTLNHENGDADSTVLATFGSNMPTKYKGTQTTLVVPVRSGYTLGGYYDEIGGGGTRYYNSTLGSAHKWDKASESTLYAMWWQNITLNREGGSGSSSVKIYYHSATFATTLTIPTKAGYTFGGYYSGDDGTDDLVINTDGTLQTSVTGYTDASGRWIHDGATTLYAKWIPNTYDVTLNHENGTPNSMVLATYGTALPFTLKDSETAIAKPTKTGYTFYGYYDEIGGGGTIYYNSAIDNSRAWNKTSDATLYARWRQYIKLDREDGTSVPDLVIANYHYELLTSSFDNPTKTGYTFGGYYDGDDGTGNLVINTDQELQASVTGCTDSDGKWIHDGASVTLHAKWTANTYDIAYKDGGDTEFSGTHEDGYPTTHTYGTATTLKSATKTGYTFGGWYTSSACTGAAVTSLGATAYTDDITLYAKWTIKTYTITLEDGGAATAVSPTSVTATYNSSSLSSAITAPVQSGYTFDGWWTGEGGKSGVEVIDSDGYLQASVAGYTDASSQWIHDGDVTLYAKWDVEGGGGGEPSGDCEGTGCKEALLGGNVFTNGYDYTITSDNSGNVNISVTFLDHQTGMSGELYMLNSSGGELGGVTFITWNNSTYTATHTLTGQSGTIYFKVRVPYSGGVYVTKMFTVNVGVDCTEGGGGSTYTVTYNANGADDGTAPVDPWSPYLEDATVTVLGNPHDLTKAGSTFNGWNTAEDGNGIHYAAGSTFTITDDVTLYAEWKDTSDPTLCSNNGGPESGQTFAGSSKFTTGYTLSVKRKAAVSSSNPDSLVVSAEIKDEATMGRMYLIFHSAAKNYSQYAYAELANGSKSVSNKAVAIPAAVTNDKYAYLSVKFEVGGSGVVKFTDRMLFDLENGGCVEPEEGDEIAYFDIYHYDDAPVGARTSYSGDHIVTPIRYFRHFDDNWSSITLPFDVDSVGVYDEADKKLYLLYPRFYNGSTDVEGYYWLKTFNNWSSTTVSVANFQSSWQQPTYATSDDGSTPAQERNLALNVLPQKNVPYVIAFPHATYYNNNWVIFYGAPFQTIPSSEDEDCVGTLAGETGQLKLQRNNMMKPTSEMTNIYMLEEGYDYFARQTSAVPAFESYVLGTSDVIEQYVQIRYRGGGNLPTEVESLPTTSGYDGVIYTVSGICIATFAGRDAMEAKLSTLPSGVYVVRCGSTVDKVVVR